MAEETQVLQVEGPAEEEPAPAEVRTHLDALVGREHDALAVAAEDELLEVAGGLQHDRPLIVLRLDILVLQSVEAADGVLNLLLHPLQRLVVGRQGVCSDDIIQVVGIGYSDGHRQQQHEYQQQLLTLHIFPKMRSIAQFTGVAETLVHVQSAKPCKCSMTFLINGNCT